MPGTIRKIIERIKDKRSGGNSVVALTVETRLVLQGFDPQRYDYDTPDDAGRLARIAEIAEEMQIDVADLVQAADVEPDPDAAPVPPPQPHADPASAAARTAAVAAAGGQPPPPAARVPDDHPLRRFRALCDSLLEKGGHGPDGRQSGAGFDLLIKSSVLMALYSLHKDAVFCDLLRHDALFQWFLDLSPGGMDFEPRAFFQDREQALASNESRRFFDRLVPLAGREKLFSADVFQASAADFKSWMTPRGSLR